MSKETTKLQRRKEVMLEQLKKITIKKISDTSLRVICRNDNFLTVRTDYDVKTFSFAAGQFVHDPRQNDKKLYLVFGAAYCPESGSICGACGRKEHLWTLEEGDEGISFYSSPETLLQQGYVVAP